MIRTEVLNAGRELVGNRTDGIPRRRGANVDRVLFNLRPIAADTSHAIVADWTFIQNVTGKRVRVRQVEANGRAGVEPRQRLPASGYAIDEALQLLLVLIGEDITNDIEAAVQRHAARIRRKLIATRTTQRTDHEPDRAVLIDGALQFAGHIRA